MNLCSALVIHLNISMILLSALGSIRVLTNGAAYDGDSLAWVASGGLRDTSPRVIPLDPERRPRIAIERSL